MHLQFGPETPALLRAAATAALVLHVGGASLGMVSGAVALFARKGARLHRLAGNVFVGAMLTMSAVAAVVAPLLPDRFSSLMGVFVFYLTATAWMAVKRPAGTVGRFEAGAALAAVGLAAANVAFAQVGSLMPNGIVDGQPSGMGYFFGLIAALAAAADVSVIRRGGVSGPSRVARHLWRMTLALAITWGSFAAQPKAQPDAIRNSPYLFLPALGILLLMAFWLVRTYARRRPRPRMAAVAAA